MSRYKIDINADVGEGIGNETDLMPFLSSCNIACGGHAGTTETMREVVKQAKFHQVKIGAHPSFPDTENFGRHVLEMSSADLYTSLQQQIESLLIIINEEKMHLHHVKPHGALYNLAAKDVKTAKVIIDVIKSFELPLHLYAPYNSVIANCALAENIEVCFEGFADRNYNDDLSLVSRQKSNAILHDSDAVFKHVFKMISEQKIATVNRVEVDSKIDTICLHSDTENAVVLAEDLHRKLLQNSVTIK